jgi:hypothetical protein
MASRSRVKFYVIPVGVYRLGKEQSFEIVVCGAGGAEGRNRTECLPVEFQIRVAACTMLPALAPGLKYLDCSVSRPKRSSKSKQLLFW